MIYTKGFCQVSGDVLVAFSERFLGMKKSELSMKSKRAFVMHNAYIENLTNLWI